MADVAVLSGQKRRTHSPVCSDGPRDPARGSGVCGSANSASVFGPGWTWFGSTDPNALQGSAPRDVSSNWRMLLPWRHSGLDEQSTRGLITHSRSQARHTDRIWQISLEQIDATVSEFLGTARLTGNSLKPTFGRDESMYLARHVGRWSYRKSVCFDSGRHP